MTAPDWPAADDTPTIAGLRQVLRREGYTAEGIQQAFGQSSSFTRDPSETPLHVRRLAPDAPLSTLIKLFVLDLGVPRGEAEAAFAPVALERLAALRVLELDGDRARATLNLFPSGELVIAADLYAGEGSPRGDHVLGLALSTRVLAALTVRHFVASALDIGTGSGVHALTAADHVQRVVGVDINPRALRFAEFNAALNGVNNVEFRQGSVFEPVEGEQFDLVVSNPPFVVSPDSDYAFRDSGLSGDSFSEGLIRRAPEFLTEGGLAQVLVEWVQRGGEEWSLAPRRWVDGSGCDALILHLGSQDPLSYAGTWNAELRRDPAAYASAIDRWVDYDRRLGIERIAWGAIVLRRRTGQNWMRAISAGLASIGPAAHHVERLILAQDYLSGLPADDGLLEQVLGLADDHRFDQTFTLRGGEGELERSALRLEGGLGLACELDPLSVRVVSLLDGERRLRDVLAEAAQGAPGTTSREEFAVETMPIVRSLLELGLVVPVL